MALKRINSVYFLADTAEDLKDIPKPEMGEECYVISEVCEYRCDSEGKWHKQVNEEYATKSDLEATKANTIFGEDAEKMERNPGSAFGISVGEDEADKSIVDAMLEKGIGLYTFWIYKSNNDLPAEVKAKNSSCRGLCCVDTVKETGWYGWIQLFDHDGYMYTRYIRNGAPTDWRAC